ncbi:hypothetical protein KPL74_07830 [Bacillus sp. NP157]|nr:hypothetical protein KPL74_07830 [Bacillus sp. NP157]
MPASKSAPETLPPSEEITVEWLRRHIPIIWWYWVAGGTVAALAAVTGSAFYLGKTVAVADGAYQLRQINDDKARVASEVQGLEIRKAELEGAVARLEAEKYVSGLSREQVLDEMRKRGALRD